MWALGRKVLIEAHVSSAQTLDKYEERILTDPILEEVRDTGSVDDRYTAVIKALRVHISKAEILSTIENPNREYMGV